ncbi:MAG: cobalamin-dependent protein [Thermincola sp.]|jgi:methylmalonyl-CoA mutase cobalamin-binding domain/chain|nr:cobalamin-dependent protein [Thermincola sp.]MDT3703293.1 cobalamin-dependent protein [Thermincola sp.]
MEDLKKIERKIIEHVEQLDQEEVITLADQALDAGIEPLRLLELMDEGMNRVGQLYESKIYFIADLIMAGLIFKDIIKLEKMAAHFQRSHNKRIGTMLIGTVKDDIHDIGKDIFRSMAEANGFEVIDIGVDVPKELFVSKIIENKPDIVGLSGVLTNTIEAMREVVEAIDKAGLRDTVRIIAGGNHITEDACRFIGADSYANDASLGVKRCKEWISSVLGKGVHIND